MKFCTKCGAQMEDDALFCPKCGNKVNSSGVSNPVHQQPAGMNQSPSTYSSGPSSKTIATIVSIFDVVTTLVGTVLLVIGIVKEVKFQEELGPDASKYGSAVIKLARELSEYGDSTNYLIAGGIIFGVGLVLGIIAAVLRKKAK